MKVSRLEEVLEECLSAYLDGRRTIEESLSLYPDVRRELEPLLRTAVELAEAYADPRPPPGRLERGRQEFLNSASVRRRARDLTQDVKFSRRLARAALGRPQTGLIVASVLTFAAVATAVTAFDSSSSDKQMQAGFVPPPVNPAIRDLRQTQDLLRDQLTNRVLGEQDVSPEFFREIAERTRELEIQIGEFDSLDEQSRWELKRAIGNQARRLRQIVDSQPPTDVAPAAYHALGLTEQLADEWGVDLPETPVASVPASPSVLPTQAPTPAATPSPGEGASPMPTPESATLTPPPPSAAPQVP
jgi:hypothetical protein